MSKLLPKLYSKTKLGGIQEWQVWADGADVVSEYGRLGGAKQIARYRAVATNVGRSNARSGSEQAEFEAKSMWQKRLDKKYSETIEEAQLPLFLPMLAKDFKTEKNITYPVHVQPKLDGVRCIAYRDVDGIQLMSRGGKFYSVPHVAKEVNRILDDGTILDGELYIHGLNCQTITSYVKKDRPESQKITYWVYDVPVVKGVEDLPWFKRFDALDALRLRLEDLPDVSFYIVPVATYIAIDEAEVYRRQSQFLSKGFEGAIVRDRNGTYQWGYRSHYLLKVKNFKDGEFKVVGCEEGKGKLTGCAVWVCETSSGAKFSATPKGTHDQRQEYWEHRNNYIGKMLTVKYFEMTTDNIPRFPVGIHFRAEEDLPS